MLLESGWGLPRIWVPDCSARTLRHWGVNPTFTDIGNAFEKAGVIATTAMRCCPRRGTILPQSRPGSFGDTGAARVAWAYAIVSAWLFGAMAVVGAGRRPAASFAKPGGPPRCRQYLWLPGSRSRSRTSPSWIRPTGRSLRHQILQTEPGASSHSSGRVGGSSLRMTTLVSRAPRGRDVLSGLVFGCLAHWGFAPACACFERSLRAFARRCRDNRAIRGSRTRMSWLYWRAVHYSGTR